MYGEENSWSVTIYGENRESDLDKIRALMDWCKSHRISFGSSFILELPWMPEEERIESRRFAPYVWLPHCDEEAVRALLHEAGINPPLIPFEKVKSEWDDKQPLHPLLPP